MEEQNGLLVDRWSSDLYSELLGDSFTSKTHSLDAGPILWNEPQAFEFYSDRTANGVKTQNGQDARSTISGDSTVSGPVIASEISGEADIPARENQVHGSGRRRRTLSNTQTGRMTANELVDELSHPHLDPHYLVVPHLYGEIGGAGEGEAEQPLEIIVHPQVGFLCDLHGHLCDAEIIGLLAGKWDPTRRRLYVQTPFPCSAMDHFHEDDDGATDVELDPVAEIELRAVIAAMDMQVVGWYHSHPRFQPHPSVTDIQNQRSLQEHLTDAAAGVSPFVALIVSTYDEALPSPAAVHQWFHVKQYVSTHISKAKTVAIPMLLHATYAEINCASLFAGEGRSRANPLTAGGHKEEEEKGRTNTATTKHDFALFLPIDVVSKHIHTLSQQPASSRLVRASANSVTGILVSEEGAINVEKGDIGATKLETSVTSRSEDNSSKDKSVVNDVLSFADKEVERFDGKASADDASEAGKTKDAAMERSPQAAESTVEAASSSSSSGALANTLLPLPPTLSHSTSDRSSESPNKCASKSVHKGTKSQRSVNENNGSRGIATGGVSNTRIDSDDDPPGSKTLNGGGGAISSFSLSPEYFHTPMSVFVQSAGTFSQNVSEAGDIEYGIREVQVNGAAGASGDGERDTSTVVSKGKNSEIATETSSKEKQVEVKDQQQERGVVRSSGRKRVHKVFTDCDTSDCPTLPRSLNPPKQPKPPKLDPDERARLKQENQAVKEAQLFERGEAKRKARELAKTQKEEAALREKEEKQNGQQENVRSSGRKRVHKVFTDCDTSDCPTLPRTPKLGPNERARPKHEKKAIKDAQVRAETKAHFESLTGIHSAKERKKARAQPFRSLLAAVTHGSPSSAAARWLLCAVSPSFRSVVTSAVALGFYYSQHPRRTELGRKWKSMLRREKARLSASAWLPRMGLDQPLSVTEQETLASHLLSEVPSSVYAATAGASNTLSTAKVTAFSDRIRLLANATSGIKVGVCAGVNGDEPVQAESHSADEDSCLKTESADMGFNVMIKSRGEALVECIVLFLETAWTDHKSLVSARRKHGY